MFTICLQSAPLHLRGATEPRSCSTLSRTMAIKRTLSTRLPKNIWNLWKTPVVPGDPRTAACCSCCVRSFFTGAFTRTGMPIVEAFEVDHIVSLECGGTDTVDNLQLLCLVCHQKKTSADNYNSHEMIVKKAICIKKEVDSASAASSSGDDPDEGPSGSANDDGEGSAEGSAEVDGEGSAEVVDGDDDQVEEEIDEDQLIASRRTANSEDPPQEVLMKWWKSCLDDKKITKVHGLVWNPRKDDLLSLMMSQTQRFDIKKSSMTRFFQKKAVRELNEKCGVRVTPLNDTYRLTAVAAVG